MKAVISDIHAWIKKRPIRGRTYFYTTKKEVIDAIDNKNAVCVVYVKQENILYEKKK